MLLFDGKPEVEENELVNTTVHSQYKAEDGKVHEQYPQIYHYYLPVPFVLYLSLSFTYKQSVMNL